MIKYPYRCILKYVPSSYVPDQDWQERNRNLVYRFKQGICSDSHMKRFQKQCMFLIKDMAIDWVVCFAPCSSEERTEKRFRGLCEFLSRNLPCEVHMDTFVYLGEKFPSYLWGKKVIDNATVGASVDHFFGKHVILIDDVISTGKTFNKVGDLLVRGGALSVEGLFFSRTVYPKRLQKTKNKLKIRSK